MKRIFTEEQISFMKNNYCIMSYKDIASRINKTERQVRGWLNNNGFTKNRKVNHDYFKDIDTPLKAYLLGFIFADGWIVSNETNSNYEFGMELQSQDKYVLEKINEVLGNQNIIYHTEPEIREICGCISNRGATDTLRVYSKELVKNLLNNGIETNKTEKDTYPVVKDELFFDWLRGYIDGDGCYYVKNNNTIIINIACGSNKPLEYIKNILKKYNISTHIYKEKDKKYRLYCGKYNDCLRLINRLYYEDGLFFLLRKHEKIKHLIGLAA